MFRNSLLLSVFIIVSGVATFAQPRPTPTPARPAAPQTPPGNTTPSNAPVPESRIALIDTQMFGDEKNGIYRYVDAVKGLEPEFRSRNAELVNLQNRINALADDIKKLRAAPVVDQKTIQAKADEGNRLQQDFTTKKNRLNEDVSKRYQEVTGPLSEQIGKAMDEFARQRGITMTLDLSKLLPALLTAVPAVDVTEAFIADFNRKNPRTGPPR
jgi:Skp family chaperone for outer membrane proteins